MYCTRFLRKTMGGGVAFLDYDADGDPVLLLVNSGLHIDVEHPFQAPRQVIEAPRSAGVVAHPEQ